MAGVLCSSFGNGAGTPTSRNTAAEIGGSANSVGVGGAPNRCVALKSFVLFQMVMGPIAAFSGQERFAFSAHTHDQRTQSTYLCSVRSILSAGPAAAPQASNRGRWR